MNEPLTKKLSIFLIKEEFKSFEITLKTRDITKFKLKESIEGDGLIIIGHERSKEPDWKKLLQSISEDKIPNLNNSSNRAILFFRINNRIFALCFGFGKYLLHESCIEREFGLRTALNIVDADKLISIDKANIGDLNLLTKTQASQKGSPHHFEIDILRDLLKGVTGEPKNAHDHLYGKIVTGNESLNISPKIKLSKVPSILTEIHDAYFSNDYKERFDWIDNIKPEKDPEIIDELRNKLLYAINNQITDSLHLAPPFMIDWEDFEYISFTPKGQEFNEFNIIDFYDYKFEEDYKFENWEKLMNQNLYVKFSTYDDSLSNKLWRFLNYETELNNFRYIFTSSNWYKISKTYYDDIYRYCSEIKESESVFIDCNTNEEGIYNKRLFQSNDDYLLFDKDLIKSAINRSHIEVCDVFNKSKNEFIHVKFRNSSSTLSHLFSQGRVASNALQKDKDFRKNLRNKLKDDRELIPLENKDFNPNNFIITYAIIDSKERNFVDSLPFFSLINFRLTLDDLVNRGFQIRVKNIFKNKYIQND